MIEISNDSVLVRYWRSACTISWGLFLLYEAIIGYDKFAHEDPLCPLSDENFPVWYWYSNFAVFGAFVFVWLTLFIKVNQIHSAKEKIPHLVAFNIVSMGTLATGLALFFDWGGLCIDVLGVASPAAIWGEWCACGPLLIFIIVTLDNKPKLASTDWIMMGTFFICLVFGFLIIVPAPYGVGVFWLVASVIAYIPILYLPFYCHQPIEASVYPLLESGEGLSRMATLDICHLRAKRFRLTMVLSLILPLFTLNYLLASGGAIGPDATVAVYQILSVLTKGVFASVTMDIHFDLIVTARMALSEENDRRANEARRSFLKYIFHELRSPLNSLAIGIEILGSGTLRDQQDLESLAMMRDASSFMSDTLNDVLSMQKIEEGKLELDLIPFCLNDAVNKVFATLRGVVSQKRIHLVKSVEKTIPTQIIGDRYRIEHVIANLLSNAIKFSSEDSTIEVALTLEAATEFSAIIRLSVTDTGPGVSAEDQLKLFNNFVQIRPGQLQKGRGSGLGLAIAKKIVELHGGKIGVTSTEGQGSTFYFTVPFQIPMDVLNHRLSPVVENCSIKLIENKENELAATSPISDDNLPSPITAKAVRVTAEMEQLGVMIVDDSDSNRKMLRMLLRKLNIDASMAEDGKQGVEAIMEQPDDYQVIFMDNLMPVMSGVEATKQLRAMGFKRLIVGVTGNVLEDDVAEYLAAGADLIFPKPIRVPTLHLLLQFIQENGTESCPDMQLVEHRNKLHWVPKVHLV